MSPPPAAALSPELRLLAACMLWPPGEARLSAVRGAAAVPALDWDRFAQAVDRHRAAGFAHDGLVRAGIAAPEVFRQALARRAAQDGLVNQVFARETVKMIGVLEAAGVATLALKGAGLATLVYGDLAVRQSRDLDLLVAEDDLTRADEVCREAGYRRLQPPPDIDEVRLAAWRRWRKDFIYRHDRRDLTLELHFRPVLDPVRAARLDLWAARRPLDIAGVGAVSVPDGPALYAYLCLHGALCGWFRMKWLADLSALLASRSEAEVEALHDAAVARGVGRASGQALLLLERVFGRSPPAGLRTRLDRDPAVRWLVNFAVRVMADRREPDAAPLGASAIELSHLVLAEDWRSRRQEIGVWLVDWPLVFALGLPRVLWFLYPLLRGPAWLARKLRSPRPARTRARP